MVVMASLHGVVGSERDAAHANELLVRAQALAFALKEPLALTHVFMGRAVCAFLLGRAEDALELSKEAERYYNMHRGAEEPGEYYLRSTLRTTRVGALFQLGRFRDARKELQETVEAARAADSRTILLQLSLVIALDDIAQNEPQRSRERLNRERAQLPAQGFGALHLVHMIAVMRVACALGDYAWARDIVDVMWPRFQRSLGRHSVFATLAYSAHARYLLNRHVIERRSGDPNALVRDDLRALHKLSDRVGPAAYTRFRARVAYLSGGRDRALSLYRQHVESCARERYFDEIERANWALGRVLGGEEGARLCAEAIARLRERGMLNPEREIESHFPELVELERSA
jgi:tetratricopeptide (TPR) repeat protein